MLHLVEKELNLEVIELLKHTEMEIFQGHASNNEKLLQFDWKQKEESLRNKAPFLHGILRTVLNPKQKKDKQFIPHMMTAAAVLLYGRSQRQNQLQYILGLVLDKCGLTKEGMKILHDLGIAISTTSIQRKKKQLIAQQEKRIQKVVTDYVKYVETKSDVEMQRNNFQDMEVEVEVCVEKQAPFEVLGDNLDITITPSKMTMQSQRKSCHWFLLLVKQKRVIIDNLNIPDEDYTKKDISKLPCATWIPTIASFHSLLESFAFHIAHILLKYVSYLSQVKEQFPKHLQHMHMEQMKQKTLFLNCDLIDASENSSQGMIEILQKVHNIAVPHLRNEKQKDVLEKVVFGGDVLTNERAFSAQEAMQNTADKFDGLGGIIHRPEGLHRLMNFTLVSCNIVALQFS